ncbi:hypothetical protein MUK42_16818 [Musa troglodytarum]|nr:hypothetical protein MUK42_16818 [Musa troglodytarum]
MVCTKCINHLLFQMLLDKAEKEFWCIVAGPLELPYNIKLFQKGVVRGRVGRGGVALTSVQLHQRPHLECYYGVDWA